MNVYIGFQESEIADIRRQISQAAKGGNLEDEPELSAAFTENAKLKHRLAILNRVRENNEFLFIDAFIH